MSVTPGSDYHDFYDRVAMCMHSKHQAVPPRDMFASRQRAIETMREAARMIGEEAQEGIGFAALEVIFKSSAIALSVLDGLGDLPVAWYCGCLVGCLIQAGVPENHLPRFNIPAEMVAKPEPPQYWEPSQPAHEVSMWPGEPDPPVEVVPPSAPPAPERWTGHDTTFVVMLAAMGVILAAVFIYGRPATTTPNAAGSPSSSMPAYYFHWNCGSGNWQCAQVWGSYVGVKGPLSSADCDSWISTKGQPYSAGRGDGDWCDTSSQAAQAP